MRRNRTNRWRRLRTLAATLLLATLAAVPSSGTALAQEPPDPSSPIVLVNADDEDLVERKSDGRFIARPVFDRELPIVYFGVGATATRASGSSPCTACAAASRSAATAGSTPSSTPSRTARPNSTPSAPTCS